MSDAFVITGFGRSGTTFLAHALNCSPTWSVQHEPAGANDTLEKASARLRQSRYGEVNSRLRNWLWQLPVSKRAVIVRNPYDIAVSLYNRHPIEVANRLAGVWELLDKYISAGTQVFHFERFTTDAAEIHRVAEWAGIDDLEIPESIVSSRINQTKKRTISRYEEIPLPIRRAIGPEIEWFARCHYDAG